jgi:hypothetical protein
MRGNDELRPVTDSETNSRLLEKLETLGWPQPFAEALDPYEDQRVAEFQTAFVDLLTLEHLCVILSRESDAKRAHPPRACVCRTQASQQPDPRFQQALPVGLCLVEQAKALVGAAAARTPAFAALQVAVRRVPRNKPHRQGPLALSHQNRPLARHLR